MLIINNPIKVIKESFLLIFVCLHLCFLTACQDKQKSVETIIQGCQVFFDKDNLEEASNCIQKAMFANPEQAEEISKLGADAFFKKCVEIKDKKDYQKSIICFEGLTVLMPNSANVQFNLADSYFEFYKENGYEDNDLLDEAEKSVRKGLEIRTDDIKAQLLYAEILESKRKYWEALVLYKRLVKVRPKEALFWTNLGYIQQKLDKDKEAIESFEESLRLNPNISPAQMFLAISYRKIGNTQKAIEVLEKLLEQEPDNTEAQEELEKLKEKHNSEKPKAKSKTAG